MPEHILFICTGNICRSPMAEYYLRHLIITNGLDLYTSSAGTYGLDDHVASANGIIVMDELGIDMRKHRGRSITQSILKEADIVLTMESYHLKMLQDHHPHVQMLSAFIAIDRNADIADPYGQDVSQYRIARDRIIDCITAFSLSKGYS